MQMPKLVALVSQLVKELDIKKVIKEVRPHEQPGMTCFDLIEDICIKHFFHFPLVALDSISKGDSTQMIGPNGGAIDLDKERLLIPGGALSNETSVRFKRNDPDKLRQSVDCSQWSGMLNVITVMEITCRPPVTQFNKPVLITVPLPDGLKKIPSYQLRLLQSNYMSNWQDITDDPRSGIELIGNSREIVQIRTDLTGWLIVARIDFDITKVMQMAIKSVFHAEPMMVNVNVFGCIFPDNHAQIVVYLKSAPENRKQQRSETPAGFTPISIPHSIKAHVGQRLRVEVEGLEFESGCEPSTEFVVEEPLNQIVEKTVNIGSPKGLKGRLTISSYCNAPKGWRRLEEIDLYSNSFLNNRSTH